MMDVVIRFVQSQLFSLNKDTEHSSVCCLLFLTWSVHMGVTRLQRRKGRCGEQSRSSMDWRWCRPSPADTWSVSPSMLGILVKLYGICWHIGTEILSHWDGAMGAALAVVSRTQSNNLSISGLSHD